MRPHEEIREQRLRLALSQAHLARAAGLPEMAYHDLEIYESEIYDCIELRQLRKICATLQLDILSLLGVRYVEPVESLENLLRTKRTERELSVKDVSDRVGIAESAIRDAENDGHTLEAWRLTPLIDYANTLGLSLAHLVPR
jgi:DNA-binding XRE family transcriptional regulator